MQYKMRQTIDVRLREPLRQSAITLPHEEFIYGKANRPSTPMKAVMGGFYGDVAEQETLNRYETIKAQSRPIPML
jgi:hypothetical protein